MLDNSKNNDVIERDNLTIDWVDQTYMNDAADKHLKSKNIYKNKEYQEIFIADLFDTIDVQLDQISMEYPLFSLKGGSTEAKYYEQGNFKVKIDPNNAGQATIHDKDIWIYAISKLMQAKLQGEEIDRKVYFTIYDYLKYTGRSTSGRDYERAKESLERLSGTRITTNIETNGKQASKGFGLLDEWGIVEEKDGKMIRVYVVLPEWLYRSIESRNVVKLNVEYFQLRKPFDRRIYELARRHCKFAENFTFNEDTLMDRVGGTSSAYEFRKSIKLIENNKNFPDYQIKHLPKAGKNKQNQVKFINKNYQHDTREKVSLADFTSKYGNGSKEEIAIKIFMQGKLLSQEVIKHPQLGFSGKELTFLKKNAEKRLAKLNQQSPQPNNTNKESIIFTNDFVQKIKKMIDSKLQDNNIDQNDDSYDGSVLIEISDAYDHLSSVKNIVDINNNVISESSFKEALYDAYDID